MINITGGNVIATSNVNTVGIVATSNVVGNFFIGNGSLLTGLPATYSNANVASFLATGFGSNTITTSSNISAGNVNATTVYTNNVRTLIGDFNLTTNSGNTTINTDKLFLLTGLLTLNPNFAITTANDDSKFAVISESLRPIKISVPAVSTPPGNNKGIILDTPNVQANGTLTVVGNVTAPYFIGNGSLLTGVSGLTNAQVVSYIATQPLTVGGNLQVNGNLDVTGNVNYQNVTDLYVRDQIIVLNANASTNSNVQIIANRPTATNTSLRWNEQSGRWEFTNNGTTYFPIPTSTTDLIEGANLYFRTDRANTNSNAWLTTKTTTDLAEGANLYYTTARANSAIGAYQGAISTAGNITTTANVSGQYILGNGAFLTGITGSGTVTQVNTGENLTGGPITTTGTIGMANALANVNSVSSETAANLTLATNKQITVTTRQRNNDITNSANIRGEGFALSQTDNFFNAPFFSYSGSEQLKTIGINGSTTAGSNVISVTSLRDMQNNALNISNVKPYYAFTDQPLATVATTIFPAGTYVVSASGSNIFMSANALYSEPLNFDPGDPYGNSFGALSPGAYDATTGLLVALESDFDGGGANAQLITFNFLNNLDLKYGYGPNGPATTNFAYSIGTSSDYSINTNVINNFLFGRTDFSADQTVANFRRGVTIGDADLTNRGENDGIQTFGLNIVWDGTANTNADYGTTGVFPQMLLKQYTTGTYQATSLTNAGPRLLFIGANGKNTDDPLTTYARNNQELGRISWLSTTSFNSAPGTLGTPAYISVVSNRDQTTGPGGVGMYFVAAPTDSSLGAVGQVGAGNARQLWAAAHRGNTIISAGAPFNGNSGNVLFAPARQSSGEGNAVLLAQRIVDGACASPHWATIGYDVPTSNTGARISVTNGHNTASARNGNLSVALNRRDNAVGFGTKEWALKLRSGQTDLVLTEDGVIRTTFTGANITTAGNVSASTFLGNIVGTTGNFTGNVSASTVNAAFFVGDGSNITNINYSNANVQQYLAFGLGSNNINTTGNITAGNTIVNGVSFNTAGTTAPSSGQIVYNSTYGTHQVGLDGSNVMLMGQDLVVYALNDEANTLSKGEVVYLSGANGNHATVRRAVNNTDANSATTIGIVKGDIAAGQLGYIVSQGVVDGLNLGSYTAGDKLYLGNVAGTFTNVKPQSPEHYVFIGVVQRANAGNGQILVRVQNGFELDEIHDVNVTNVQPNDILFRNAGNTLWVNQNLGTTLTNTNITLKQFNETRVNLGSTGGNITLNMANGSIFAMTATSNISNIALSNASIGASGTLIITQDGTGSKTLTTTSAWKFAGGSKTLTTTANAIDIVNFFTDGTTVFAALSKGYS